MEGVITPHECDECHALRRGLEGNTWDEVRAEFIDENEGSLTLLSHEAYLAYLPAWLSRALHDPAGHVASMLLVNLRHEPETGDFTARQRETIVAVARYIVENACPPNNPIDVESLAAIEHAWSSSAA